MGALQSVLQGLSESECFVPGCPSRVAALRGFRHVPADSNHQDASAPKNLRGSCMRESVLVA